MLPISVRSPVPHDDILPVPNRTESLSLIKAEDNATMHESKMENVTDIDFEPLKDFKWRRQLGVVEEIICDGKILCQKAFVIA